MRIAMVCPYDVDRPGGVQEHVVHLVQELRAAGDEVLTIAPGQLDGRHVDVGVAVGVPFNGSRAPVALGPATAWRTRQAIAAFRPDVVHVHEPAVPLVGTTAAAVRGVPVVTTHHAWAERPGLYGVVGGAVRARVQRAAARIAVSTAARDHHARALRLPAGSFDVVPNGVDVDRFAAARPLDRLREDGPVVLFVGRLEPRKGLEVLVRAFARLKAEHPRLRLVVVGDGPERERCQALLPAGLRVDVDFLGRVSAADLPRCFASADVFVAPNLGGESFGIVLLEALAAGTPVVASDLPGFRSVVQDGVHARLAPPGDATALAAQVTALLDNPALADAQVEAGRAHVQSFAWPWVAAQVRSVHARAVEAG